MDDISLSTLGLALAVLLADDAVLRVTARQPLANELLDAAVGLRDRSEVWLGLDYQVGRAVARHRDRVRRGPRGSAHESAVPLDDVLDRAMAAFL